jgi:RNA polymerase sigma factor (sigma-70 family)
MSESTIWESLRSGEMNSLRALYDQYADGLYQYGMALTKDPDKVKDCIHDLFVSIWTSRDKMSVPHSGKAYLMVSLRRRLFDKGSKIDTLTEASDNMEASNLSLNDHEAVWIDHEDAEKQSQLLERAMNRLSERQKEIIHMKYFQELDYEQIGQIMDLNYQSARNLVNRAIAALRKEMLGLVMILLMFM